MFGPALDAASGIAAVVNNWKIAELDEFVSLRYIPTIDFNGPGRYFLKLSNGIRSYIKFLLTKQGDYDLIHIHLAHGTSFYRKFVIFLIGYLRKDLILIHLHGSDFEIFYTTGGRLRKKIISWMFDHANALIVLSKKWKEFAQSICSNDSIYILYNGALPELFAPKICNSNKINILFMGELGARKGSYDLVNAFNSMCNKIPNVFLILGGDGEIDKTRILIKKKGIYNKVKLKGWISGKEKIDAFRNADIYVLPSYNEGLPVSILEAMAAGLPIISTPVGGISEAVIQGVNGYLIHPGDCNSLSEALEKLCSDDQLRKRMGIESLRLVNENFHLVKIVGELEKIYKQIWKAKLVN